MIYTVTLNPSIDRHLAVDRLRLGQLHKVRSSSDVPGGKGINVSRVLQELGIPVKTFVLLGGSLGDYHRALMQRYGIGFSAIRVKNNTRLNLILSTGHALLKETQLNEPGPRITASDIRSIKSMLFGALPRPRFWVFSGSLCPGCPQGLYAELIRKLQQNKVRCLLDSSGPWLKAGLAAKPYLIKPNEDEMRQLTGKPLKTVEDFAAEAELLVRKGIKLVVVSMAKKGALFMSAKEAYHAIPPPIKPIRTQVGIGDALVGGILSGFERGMPLQDIARVGVAVSLSAAIHNYPASLCCQRDIKSFIRKVRLRAL